MEGGNEKGKDKGRDKGRERKRETLTGEREECVPAVL